ncbi:MAG: Mth938-like domain-containing protein [Kangiellaceae bacterium]|nr:Mth938-like domain-containing protein [Kangiellaceae bacterium]MCW9018025.1 Mth938-like domain-containing protein [Kangiellaceae bacterium]
MLFQKESNTNRVIIKGYEPGNIQISGQNFSSPVLIDESSIQEYPTSSFDEIDFNQLIEAISEDTEVVILGTGEKHKMISATAIQKFNQKGIAVEAMGTRPACHTFQVLVHERRKVVALLFP